MAKMQPLRSASQVHGLVEMLFVQLDQLGDSVKTRAHNWLAEKQRSYSGPAYLDQIEKNAVYLSESARLINAASAHYLCVGEPVLSSDEALAYAKCVGIDQARRTATLHLGYVRRGSCPGCEVCADHRRYTAWRDLRQLGDWPRYVEEMESGSVCFQGLLITAQMFLIHLLTNPQLAGIAQWVPPAEVLEVIEERVQIRSNLWLDNMKFVMPGLEQISDQVKGESTSLPADLALAEEHFSRGLIYAEQGRLDEAIKELQAALRTNPDHAEAHSRLGMAFGRQGRWDEAIREYQIALRINPNDFKAHGNLGATYAHQRLWDEAVYEYQAALRINPNHAESHVGLGDAHARQGRWDDAIQEYKAAMRINPRYATAHVNLGAIYVELSYWDDAIREFHAALGINPNLAMAHFNLGEAYRQQDRLDDAIHEFQAALRINPEYAEAHCNLGLVYGAQGWREEEIQEYRAALQIVSDDFEVRYNLAVAYVQHGLLDDAIREAERALQLGYEPARGLLNNLRQLPSPDRAQRRTEVETRPPGKTKDEPGKGARKGKKKLAKASGKTTGRAAREFGKEQPKRIPAAADLAVAEQHIGRGMAYAEQGHLDEAIREFQAALRIAPDDAGVHLNLGGAYGQQGRLDEAIREFQAALRINPNYAEAHYSLGMVYRQQGRLDEAIRELQIAAQLGFEPARELLAQMGLL